MSNLWWCPECVSSSYLKAWIMMVPKRMKRAEKIRDTMGITSRLRETKNLIWVLEYFTAKCLLLIFNAPKLEACFFCLFYLQLSSSPEHHNPVSLEHSRLRSSDIEWILKLLLLTSLSREGQSRNEKDNHRHHSPTESETSAVKRMRIRNDINRQMNPVYTVEQIGIFL